MIRKTGSENGSSLVEVIGVLAILAVISTAMMGGITLVAGRIKITQAHQQVTRLVKDMRNEFAAYTPKLTADNSAEKLFKAGIYKSSEVLYADTKYTGVNVYGQNMVIVTDEDATGNPYFSLTYEQIPPKVCADLLQADWGLDPSSGLKSISVKGTATVKFEWERLEPTAAKFLLPNLSDSIEACKTDPSDIIWEFYL